MNTRACNQREYFKQFVEVFVVSVTTTKKRLASERELSFCKLLISLEKNVNSDQPLTANSSPAQAIFMRFSTTACLTGICQHALLINPSTSVR